MSLVGPRPQAPRCFDAFPVEVQNIIMRVNPGLSGIGPIVFHDEEDFLDGSDDALDFYDRVIAPYKGDVEAWYVGKRGLSLLLPYTPHGLGHFLSKVKYGLALV